MSWDRLETRLTLTPGASSISKRVTVGPGTILVSWASTPCWRSVSSSWTAVSSSALRLCSPPPPGPEQIEGRQLVTAARGGLESAIGLVFTACLCLGFLTGAGSETTV